MNHIGQHRCTLFAGLDSDKPKTFSLEFKSCTVIAALNAMEKAITELSYRQFQFGNENSDGVKAIVRHS